MEATNRCSTKSASLQVHALHALAAALLLAVGAHGQALDIAGLRVIVTTMSSSAMRSSMSRSRASSGQAGAALVGIAAS